MCSLLRNRRTLLPVSIAFAALTSACESLPPRTPAAAEPCSFAMAEPPAIPAAAAMTAADCGDDVSWGTFPVLASYRDDGTGNEIDILLADFTYIDKEGKTWTATKDLPWDGASIPRALWTPVGSPKTGCHKLPSIVHDEYYKRHAQHGETRREVDEMFYQACRAKGVCRAKAATMYYALRWFGDRWDSSDLPACSLDAGQQELFLVELERYLDANEVELGDLDQLPPTSLAPQFEVDR